MTYLILLGASICLFPFWEVTMLTLAFIIPMSLTYLNINFTFSFSSELIWLTPIGTALIFLTLMVTLLVLIGTYNIKNYKYIGCLSSLNLVLMMAFCVCDFLTFYVMFEVSLIPTLLLILLWGYQPERMQAGFYLMLYTVTASLPLLLLLLYLYYTVGSLNFYIIMVYYSFNNNPLMLVGLMMAFLVKLPIYTCHLWLPKAHVEAPLGGSMVLAGVLLKLGGYGLYMLINFIISKSSSLVISVIITLSLWGAVIASIICIQQVDIKALVAYSSVAHMSLVSAGILMMSNWSYTCAKMTMIAHGYTSSALFVLANLSYLKIKSRSLMFMKGLLAIFPAMAFYWFLFSCMNMAAPPTLNFIGELLIIPSMYIASYMLLILMCIIMFISAGYSLYMYMTVNHGELGLYITPSIQLKNVDYHVLTAHLLPTFILLIPQLFSV
uniref:NADH-ubiquinone oxidoreductase chain 4 n=1 Tax=Albinaria caerulea TaxID=42349 RepID=NU4M_ALBCA|nr:NADH dehydrogenase subunit 4 [Albinaria caerulea]P48914.1 RecName: Full=NADH-ubiquinone oxidoreductase chain 4; AltName: Full=NADH dehydrogenase subunit 4 [Albinaria caerulea]CAA58304.1 ND4 [Albinaria caerulea]